MCVCVCVCTGDSATTDDGFCWRNLFSSINLLRILQKLTKWKHFRTVMLVMFRSAPILKRALKVRHPLTQLYILKLLKVTCRTSLEWTTPEQSFKNSLEWTTSLAWTTPPECRMDDLYRVDDLSRVKSSV